MTAPTPASATLDVVATIRSCYTQRFGIPRQAGLVDSATAEIVFSNSQNNRLSLRGLEDFSHLWVVFLFHGQNYPRSKPLVWPPRLGGKKSMGVFATRSPNRPNPVGLSAVRIENISQNNEEILIHIRGGDFLDGTPVLDIKPYVAFADSIPAASSTWVSPIDESMPVYWSEQAASALRGLQTADTKLINIKQLIEDTLAQDPRPAHERNKDGRMNQQWHMRLHELDISWSVVNDAVTVASVKKYHKPKERFSED